ncbi:MAG: hypothetical protein ACOX5G_12480 [Kiritimatiellia bacterium]|jgi:hypothetical protein
MTARHLVFVAPLAALLAAGCATDGRRPAAPAVSISTPTPAPASAVGKPVAELIAQAGEGARFEFFDADGNPLDALPQDAAGSVSIHAADGSGQQNFAFGADGAILSHKASLGEDYSAGVWTDVP